LFPCFRARARGNARIASVYKASEGFSIVAYSYIFRVSSYIFRVSPTFSGRYPQGEEKLSTAQILETPAMPFDIAFFMF
jgi:hypothetical protein